MLSSTARMSDSSAELADDSSATLLVTAGATTPLKYTCMQQKDTLLSHTQCIQAGAFCRKASQHCVLKQAGQRNALPALQHATPCASF